MVSKVRFEMFHQSRIDLHQEIKKHPDLMAILANHPQDEFEILIAEVATYCNVVLHGDYTQNDLDNLCGVLRTKLWEKRIPFILH